MKFKTLILNIGVTSLCVCNAIYANGITVSKYDKSKSQDEKLETMDADQSYQPYVSIKALEQWIGKSRDKINADVQAGVKLDTFKYEIEFKHYHPDYKGFKTGKNFYHDTKQARTHLMLNGYYQIPFTEDLNLDPFIGVGLHRTSIVRESVKLTKVHDNNDMFTKEDIYVKKIKHGMVYGVGAELSYTLLENMFIAGGWQFQEYVNAKLNSNRYNEQKIYFKLGVTFS